MDDSPLNKLSPELRNIIYAYAFTSPKRIELNTSGKDLKKQPGITRVCRQIRNESLLFFYNSNRFKFTFNKKSFFKGGERFLYPDLSRIIMWLELTPIACHLAIVSLKLKVKFDAKTWVEHHDKVESHLDKVRGALRSAGYNDYDGEPRYWYDFGPPRVCVSKHYFEGLEELETKAEERRVKSSMWETLSATILLSPGPRLTKLKPRYMYD